jgi:nitrite reductase/ring-hydroxylating ferredoxin subunit
MTDEKFERTDRRTFLVTTGTATCSLGLAACMHTNAARLVRPPVAADAIRLHLADEPELAALGGAIKLKPPGLDDTILLWRSGSGLVATSILCTHMGCEVEVADGGRWLACPCHGSQFNADGSVRHGPAARPLRRYLVDTDQTMLTIHIA